MKISLPNTIVNQEKGFTLIELLVVIGIVGILAAALLQTIDPFEQLKKGRDTVRRDTSIEYLNANTRYYASHSYFPWSLPTGACVPNVNPPSGSSLLQMGTGATGCTTFLTNDGELKTTFISATNASGDDTRIFVTYNATSNSLQVCYPPESKSFINDANTRYTQTGTLLTAAQKTACVANGNNPPSCYQCVQ